MAGTGMLEEECGEADEAAGEIASGHDLASGVLNGLAEHLLDTGPGDVVGVEVAAGTPVVRVGRADLVDGVDLLGVQARRGPDQSMGQNQPLAVSARSASTPRAGR